MDLQQSRPIDKVLSASRISRLRSEKLFKRVVSPGTIIKSIYFNDDQITAQIAKQIADIKEVIKKYQPQMVKIQQKYSERTIYQQVIDIQQKIKRKDFLLTLVAEQAKILKQSSSHPKQKQILVSLKDLKMFKLTQELKNQKLQFIKVQQQQIQKRQNLIRIKNSIKNIQQKYVQKCRKTKEKPVTYTVFKQLNEQKKKQLQDLKSKKKGRQTIKDFQQNTELTKMPNNKNMKQVLNRKHIAQQALLNAQKKHNNQINQLYAKLQFLRDQDTLLGQTIRQKQVQLINLEDKFTESKRRRGLEVHQRIKRMVLHQPKFNNFL